ncbi:hypothetical protein MP228_010453 [Amoeboaphelidium protococcarum]|nr:hypothetical protein MP228_010453 [Amoeboaphelidium protococcarum]
MRVAALICVAATLASAQRVLFGEKKAKFDGALQSVGLVVPVTLSKAPDTETFVVNVSSDDLTFANCSLTFTPQNFDQPQELVITSPGKDFAKSSLKYTTPCAKPKNEVLKFAKPGNSGKTATCSIDVGSPRVTTFDGVAYQFTIPRNLLDTPSDTVYYFKSPFLQIQGQQGDCGVSLTCTKSISVKFLDQFLTIVPWLNSPLSLSKFGTDGRLVIEMTPDSTGAVIKANDFAVITLSSSSENNVAYLTFKIDLATDFASTTSGMCGNFNGDSADCQSVLDCGAIVPPTERILFCLAGRCPQTTPLQQCPLTPPSTDCGKKKNNK